jgi:hypothetical protein
MSGPYVQAATFCETPIEGKDGTLSLVRMIDRVTINAPVGGPADAPEGGKYRCVLAIALKSDEARGRHQLSVVPERPDGLRGEPVLTLDVNFEGEERGINLLGPIDVEIIEGLYWFDVVLNDDQLLTRIPLRFTYQRVPGQRGR